MKKATLLLGMIICVVGVLYLKDADVDTVLIKQHADNQVMEQLIQDTKEIALNKEEEETESEPDPEMGEAQNTSADVVVLENKEGSSLAFFGLSMEEQKVYTEILTALLALDTKTTLSSCDRSLIDKAFQCVMLDHPEIFYVDGYKYTEYKSGDTVNKIVFSGNYLYTAEEIADRKARIGQKVADIMAGIPDTDDEYQIVKYFYETLISGTEYDMDSGDHQNICSVFLNGKSVCQGYAKAFQYLLHQAGMESGLVIGTVKDGDSHAWNLVSVNGNWYFVDVTWGDANYLLSEGEENKTVTHNGFVNYDYLCVTTEQLCKTHTVQMPVSMPECSTMTDNYYVREGLYFTEYDEERIAGLFEMAYASGKDAVTLKCSNDEVFERISTELIGQQKVFSFISARDGAIAYTDNKEQGSITFWL